MVRPARHEVQTKRFAEKSKPRAATVIVARLVPLTPTGGSRSAVAVASIRRSEIRSPQEENKCDSMWVSSFTVYRAGRF